MPQRRNALWGAAKLIDLVERTGFAHAPDGTASAVVIDAWPNNRIVLPHRAVVSFGIVTGEAATRTAMLAAIENAIPGIAAETGLGFTTLLRRLREPFIFDGGLVARTEAAAKALGHSVMRMRTRPGHDAFNMVALCPTELIFVPCRDGLSHNEREWCEPAHCAAGASVLATVMAERADRA
jgi:beta-ureidopropionase / N-carbamoyl-L-amino-acid hydrolase